MSFTFQFNQQSAMAAGSLPFISETGAYVGDIKEAKYVFGQNGSKSAGLEFSISTPDGDARYLAVYFQGRDGNTAQGGYDLINAMLGINKMQGFTQQQRGNESFAPEFEGKKLGFILQKILTTKTDGTDSHKFEIRQVFHPGTRKTFGELVENKAAELVDKLVATLKDKDQRKKGQQQAGGYGHQQTGGDSWGEPSGAVVGGQPDSNLPSGAQGGYDNW